MSAVSLELIEERLAELENRVIGAVPLDQQQQQPGQSNSADARFIELTKKMALYTTGRRNINKIFSQLQQLENALELSMKPASALQLPAADMALLKSQCEIILMEYDQITASIEQFKKVAELQSVLSSKAISSTLDYADRLNRITAKQQEQAIKLDELTAKTNAVVVAYNKMIAELGDWASVWSKSD